MYGIFIRPSFELFTIFLEIESRMVIYQFKLHINAYFSFCIVLETHCGSYY